MHIKAPRGTYDILPPDTSKWHYIEKTIKETAEVFGYREIRTPLFEHTELFERGVGETTDIVSKEMYTFTDKAGRSITLRPEGTASCARALVEHSGYAGLLPVKWYYTGPMFRYDRPQTGRYRQFHQFGAEAFGSNSPFIDAEIIALLLEILARLNINGYELRLNSVGCPACRHLYRERLLAHITPVQKQLCPDCRQRYLQNPLRVLDCKSESCHQAISGYPTLYDNLCGECKDHYVKVQEALQLTGIKYLHDDQLVRGLDYYTNTAFEIHVPEIGAQSAIGGGGRYNGLVAQCGGPDIPAIGFAIGMERLLLAMDMTGQGIELPSGIDVFVAVMDKQYEREGYLAVDQLRKAGIHADKDYKQRGPRAQMKYADKMGARVVVLIGENEAAHGFFTLRNMRNKKQITVESAELARAVTKLLLID